MSRSAAPARLVLAVLLGLAVSACAQPDSSATPVPPTPRPTPVPTPIALTALPSGFPTAWVEEGDPEPSLLEPTSRGLQGQRDGEYRAEDGTVATYTTSFVENRVPVAEISCGAAVYQDVYTAEDPVSSTTLDIPGWGEAQLEATRRVVVFGSANNGSSVALCDMEVGGVYELRITAGSPQATWSGTWLQDETGRLILQ